MRGTKALLAAVIVMGVAILLGTAVLVSVLVQRALHPASGPALQAAAGSMPKGPGPSFATASTLALDQPPDTRIMAVIRQSDSRLAVTLAGGGEPDRVLVWDTESGRIVATFHLHR